jgi:uncharacterized repeat protein (TIGR03803 family)
MARSEANVPRWAISEFDFLCNLARGNDRIRDGNCVDVDGCLGAIGASPDLQCALHLYGGAGRGFSSGGLISDVAGNSYGTTGYGGTYNQGTVFELTPTGGGGWTERVLYMFGNDPSGVSGINPEATLIYSLVQQEPAHQLGRRKVENIIATPAQAVATGNPGCQLQFAGLLNEAGHPLPVMHYIELTDASISGTQLPASSGGER